MNARAKDLYERMCSFLEKKGWKFTREDEKLLIHFSTAGEDLPMFFVLRIDPERELIRLTSPLPFQFSEDKRIDGAIATCFASYGLADGSFDYDIMDGSVSFRMTASFRNSRVGEELINYMIICSGFTVDKYNDQFLAINKGFLSISDFISK